MDPVTHALASLTLYRAAFKRKTKLAPAILLLAGTAADADWITYLFGPGAFLAVHRTVTHSLLGMIAVALVVSGAFSFAIRKRDSLRVRFPQAFLLSAAGSFLHVGLDLCDSYGVPLLWPFRRKWFAADWVAGFDLAILGVLLAGLLLPSLFALVSEEIGARNKGPRGRTGAFLALTILALYFGGRALLHQKAIALLEARSYRGGLTRQVAAFPESASPVEWHGIVETESAMHLLSVSLAPGATFDPDAGNILFKPEPSAILESAQQTRAAKEFLSFARFPRAAVQRMPEGYTVEIRDLRFKALGQASFGVMAVVQLDPQGRLIEQELRYEGREGR